MSDYTPAPNLMVALTLAAVASHHGKNHGYPTQTKLIELLARHHGIQRSRASITRHTRALEQDGLIKKVCRHRLEPGRGWTFKSTLYLWTRRGWRWITSIASAIRGWAAKPRGRRGVSPWLNSEPLSPPTGVTHGPAAPCRGPPRPEKGSPAAPVTPKEVAITHLEALRAKLQGRR